MAAICLAAITLNLAFWALPLLVLLPAKATGKTRPWFRRVTARIYRAAVRVDNVLLRHVARASWRAREPSLDPARPHIVLSNHRSWADIFLVQSLIATRGPIVTFLCKRELLYVPIFGLIILAFDFPVLRRRTRRGADPAGRRREDRRRVTEAAAALLESPAAILSFAEGTRFTAAKRDANRRAAVPRRRRGVGGSDLAGDPDSYSETGRSSELAERPLAAQGEVARIDLYGEALRYVQPKRNGIRSCASSVPADKNDEPPRTARHSTHD